MRRRDAGIRERRVRYPVLGGGGGDDGDDDDDDDDDERADIVDEYRARIIASPFRSPVGFCLSGRSCGFWSMMLLWLVSYYAHTLSLGMIILLSTKGLTMPYE
jgi:hypothetical protein